MIELAIKVKGDTRTLTCKHPIYEDFCLSEHDPTLFKLVEEAVKEFNAPKEEQVDVVVSAKLVWQ